MIVYKFYIMDEYIKTELKSGIYDHLETRLYAFTTNKKYCKQFKAKRKMDNFLYVKTEMSKMDYVYYLNNNKSCELDTYGFSSYSKDGKLVLVDVLCTASEYQVVAERADNGLVGEEMKYKYIDLGLFDDSVLEILNKLAYPSITSFSTGRSSLIIDDEKYIDDPPDYSVDEIKMYIASYNDIIKEL